MKELSIDEKARRYDEAIEKARQLCAYPTTKPFISDLQDIFPELSESEDEKIRSALLRGFNSMYANQAVPTFAGEPIKDILAWLEKQGMPAKYHDICDTCVRQPTCQSDCFLQQSKQKPTDKVEPKFKVGDVIRLKGSNAEYIITIVTDTTYYTNGWSCSIERCEEDYELVEQKPAEWSEEDERMCQETIDWFEKKCFPYALEHENPARESIRWLKSLKDRVQPQQEWGEEDDELYNDLSDTYFYNDEDYPEETYKLMLKRVLDWMTKRAKSLRPKSQWRPSKEQMDAILFVVQHYTPNVTDKLAWDSIKILELMYYEIKK